MKNNTIRFLLIGFGFSLLLILVSSVASYISINRLVDSAALFNKENAITLNLEGIISNIKDAETGYRGYIISGETRFLGPYYGAYDRAKRNYDKVVDLSAGNPVQEQYLKQLLPLIARRFSSLERGLAEGLDKKKDSSTLAEGKLIMDQVRALIDKMKGEQEAQLAKQNLVLQKYTSITPVLVIGAAILSFLIMVFAFARIRADLLKREAMKLELETSANYIQERVAVISDVAEKISDGNYTIRIDGQDNGELGDLSGALNKMASDLEENFGKLDSQAWLQKGVADLNDQLQGEKNPVELTNDLLAVVVQHLEASVGVLYLAEDSAFLRPAAAYAGSTATNQRISFGEGLVGQVASDKMPRILKNVPADLFRIKSGLLDGSPATVIIYPLVYNNVLQGVMEIGLLEEMPAMGNEYLASIASNAAIAIYAANNRLRLQELLQETQAQSEELHVQQDELQRSNAELEMQSQKLQASEEELRVQQEELLQSNQDLEEKAQLLEENNQFIEQKSRELNILNEEVEIKNKELELASKYKSEFLANMSHELRTPLNSILLLAKLLSESKELDLGDDRYEYAKVIHGSGLGLLELINEILDLSKIEAGQMQITVEDVPFEEIKKDMEQLFKPLANERKLDLQLNFNADLPSFIQSDKQRLEQILKNLLSNAIKFTEKGTVSLEVKKANGDTLNFSNDKLQQVPVVAFFVKDTGIGIPEEQQDLVFEAFKQVDGTSRRKYGGTGLGLSISREISRLLGGEIHLESVSDQGSTFTVYLPLTYVGEQETEIQETEKTVALEPNKVAPPVTPKVAAKHTGVFIQVPDDRSILVPGDKTILIVEDDVTFVKALSPFVKANGYKVLVATRGNDALALARKYQPAGILLDVNLPVMDGWSVIEHLKQDYTTRHIPVHIMSSDEARHKSLEHGAIDFISKPMVEKDLNQVLHKMEAVSNKSSRQLLIIEENIKHAAALSDYFTQNKIDTEIALSKEEGLNRLKTSKFDGVILDITDTEHTAFTMLDQIKQNKNLEKLPVIIYTGNTITSEDENRISKYATTSIIKKANTYEKVLDEISIFLHLVDEPKNNDSQRKRKNKLLDRGLEGKTILIADDDERNIYSLTKVLELQQANVITAVNGKQALELLIANPEIDGLLIDIMMPEMDGYETIRAIRQQQKYKTLPIIAVTAKTMPNDRNKCIEAGASDYISKPVDMDQLLSLLKVWLY